MKGSHPSPKDRGRELKLKKITGNNAKMEKQTKGKKTQRQNEMKSSRHRVRKHQPEICFCDKKKIAGKRKQTKDTGVEDRMVEGKVKRRR